MILRPWLNGSSGGLFDGIGSGGTPAGRRLFWSPLNLHLLRPLPGFRSLMPSVSRIWMLLAFVGVVRQRRRPPCKPNRTEKLGRSQKNASGGEALSGCWPELR